MTGFIRKKMRRKILVVDKAYQVQFAVLLVMFQINVAFVIEGITQHRIRGLVESSRTVEAFLELNLWMETLPTILLASLGLSLIVCYLGIWFSNKIVGPMPRMQRALKDIAAGDYSVRLKFRPGDALEPLAVDINKLAESLGRNRGPSPGVTTELNAETPVTNQV